MSDALVSTCALGGAHHTISVWSVAFVSSLQGATVCKKATLCNTSIMSVFIVPIKKNINWVGTNFGTQWRRRLT